MSTDLMNPVNKFYEVYNTGDMSLWNEAMAESYVGHVNGQGHRALISSSNSGLDAPRQEGAWRDTLAHGAS